MPSLFDPGIFSVVGLGGDILPGSSLGWYESGTSTPLATYSDEALTVVNPNPVPIGNDGRLPPIWLQDRPYKFTLFDPDGVPLVTRDPILPTSAFISRTLAELKAAPVSVGTSIYDGSIFVWKEGDFTGRADNNIIIQSDNVPLSQGAWVRQSVGAAYVASILPGVQTDNAPAISTLLNNPNIGRVALPAGIIWINQTIVVPANKTLLLQSGTIIRALPTFTNVSNNSGVLLNGNRAEIRGGTVDMNKVGVGGGDPARKNGVTVRNGARDCIREDVAIMNCTGYACYDDGADTFATPPSSKNTNVRTFNSQIHFEPQAADGSTYTNCDARDGDGDIACASMFHPVSRGGKLRFNGCSGIGNPIAVWETTANIGPIDDVEINGGYFENTRLAVQAFTVTAGNPHRVTNFRVNGARFIAPEGQAVLVSNFEGRFIGCDLRGTAGVQSAANSDIMLDTTTVTVSSASAGQVLYGLLVDDTFSRIRYSGGRITIVNGPAGSAAARESEPRISISQFTQLVPTPAGTIQLLMDRWVAPTVQSDGVNGFADIVVPFTNAANVRFGFMDNPAAVDGYYTANDMLYRTAKLLGDNVTFRVRITRGNQIAGQRLAVRVVELP